MKVMKMFFGGALVAALNLASGLIAGPAFAAPSGLSSSNSSGVSASSDTIAPNHGQYVCTTNSIGRYFSAMDFDLARAERMAVDSCIRGGGFRFDCEENLTCHQQGHPDPGPGPGPATYFDWGVGRDGWGYCYEWGYDGHVRNGGRPVSNHYCEAVSPSYYAWARGRNGFTYCYQFTPRGVPMNQGQAVPNHFCH